jgi:hypothetical protein
VTWRGPAPTWVPIGILAALLSGGALGCKTANPAPPPGDVRVDVDGNVSTVVHVTWTTEQPSIGYVEFGPTTELEFSTPLEGDAATIHSVSMLGLAAETTYYYRVVTWDGDDASASDVGTVTTPSLPDDIPELIGEGSNQEDFTIVPVRDPSGTVIAIVDPSGSVVWYHRETRDVDVHRALLSADRRAIVYDAVDGSSPSASELVRVMVEDGETEVISVPDLAGDFTEVEDGTLVALVTETRDVGGTSVVGNSLVEVDADGNPSTVWSAWDCFDPDTVAGADPDNGWTQANAVAYDLGQNAYYVGLRGLSGIAKVPREGGSCEWVLGGPASTWTFADGSATFTLQSHFHVRGDQLLVVDGSEAGDRPRLIEYDLDLEAELATEVTSTSSGDTVAPPVAGSVTRLDDSGTTLIDWASAGRMELVTGDGSTNWSLATTGSASFGFHTLASSLYPPSL